MVGVCVLGFDGLVAISGFFSSFFFYLKAVD